MTFTDALCHHLSAAMVNFRRDWIVQADRDTGNWYDFSIWPDRQLALEDLNAQNELRRGEKHRITERLTVDITDGDYR